MKPKFQLLPTEAATELASGGEAAAETAAPQAPAAEETSAPAASAEPRKPSFLENIAASVKDKGSLLAENKDLAARLATAETEVADLRSQLSTLNSQLENLTTERAEAQRLLDQAAAEKQSVEAKAADIVSTEIGFKAEELPSGVKAGETKEELQAELATCTDMKRRWDIAAKLNALN